MDEDSALSGVTLKALLRAIHGAFAELVVAPMGTEVAIGSVTLLDADDVADPAAGADLCLLVGVPEPLVVAWLDELCVPHPYGRMQ